MNRIFDYYPVMLGFLEFTKCDKITAIFFNLLVGNKNQQIEEPHSQNSPQPKKGIF